MYAIRFSTDPPVPITKSGIFVVGFFYSDKAVERSQNRRHHSIALQSSLKDWINKIDDICVIGKTDPLVKYSHEEERMLPIEVGDMGSVAIPHHQFLENHMKTGYSAVWVQWNELLRQVKEHNEQKAKLIEDIRQQFLSQSRKQNLAVYYHRLGRTQPKVFVAPNEIAESIVEEINNRIYSGLENWWGGKPSIREFMDGNTMYYDLNIFSHSFIMHDTDKSNVSFCIDFILSKVEDEEIIIRAEQLSNMYKANIKKSIEIKDQLNEIVSIIELGHNIKGKCKSCIKFYG